MGPLSPDELVWPTVHFHTMRKGEFSPAPIVPSALPESYRYLGLGPWPDALLLCLELSLPRGWFSGGQAQRRPDCVSPQGCGGGPDDGDSAGSLTAPWPHLPVDV